MGYEKNTWARGDVVTSAKLNHMEDGIAGVVASIPIEVSADNKILKLTKTWQEVHDLINTGVPCYGFYTETINNSPVRYMTMFTSVGIDSSNGSQVYYVNDAMSSYETSDPSGYPRFLNMS